MTGALRSRKFKILIGFLVSALLIWLITGAVEWGKVWDTLLTVQLWPVLPLSGVFVIHYILRAVRWRFLLPDGKQVPLRLSFDAAMAGNYATFLLPLRAGEFIRGWFLASRSSYSFSQAFVSIVIERFFDLATVLLMFALVLLKNEGLPTFVTAGAISLSVVAVALLAFMVVASALPELVMRAAQFCVGFGYYVRVPEKRQQGLLKVLRDFLDGVSVLRNHVNLFWIVTLSGLVWFTAVLTYYIFFYFFGVPPTLEMAAGVTVLIALAVAAPSAPGFIGVFQAGVIAAFSLYHLDLNVGGAYSILAHAFTYLVIVVYGTYVLFHYGLSLRRLQEVAQAEEEGSADAEIGTKAAAGFAER